MSYKVIEFEVDDDKIDEFIDKLKILKKSKAHLHLNINSDKELLIHHKKDKLKQNKK